MVRDRIGAALGLVGVAGNVAGVAFLNDVPAAYRPAQLEAWLSQSAQHTGAAAASAAAFVVGLAALGGWARSLGSGASPGLRAAAGTMAAGALMNAAGCVAPLVLLFHVLPSCAAPEVCAPVARALLGITLTLDAAFNLFFGLGLAGAGAALVSRGSRALGALGLAAGLATLPVSGQVFSERAASLLYVAAPLWLAFVMATSARMWRAPAEVRRAAAAAPGRPYPHPGGP